MEQQKKSFIEELRSLDESMKRRVIIVSTIIIMIVIAYLWIGYFSGLVSAVPQTPVANDQVQQDSDTPSGAATLENGFGNVGHWFANLFQSPGQYNIQPPK